MSEPRDVPDLPLLYLIADRATCAPRKLEDVLAEALDAGVRLVQLRERHLEMRELRRLAARLQRRTSNYEARLLVNTHAGLARDVGAAGVHLPSSGPDAWSVRRQYGSHLLIGRSTHNRTECWKAEGADFVTFSPIYSPGSKPGYGPGVGPRALRRVTDCSSLPVYALGGITPGRVSACKMNGAAGIAVMSGILAARHVSSAVRDYLEAWASTSGPRHPQLS
ncbi:MAG: thiamine phosphate synthase [Gemmatimonadetes bacterium]|nr:thiamine phosphate synthase [Gemmatimonadota bacterium]